MEDAASFDERTLVRANDGAQDIESAADKLRNAFVDNITTGYGTVVSRAIRVLRLRDQGDSSDVSGLGKSSSIEEILDYFYHISAYN